MLSENISLISIEYFFVSANVLFASIIKLMKMFALIAEVTLALSR